MCLLSLRKNDKAEKCVEEIDKNLSKHVDSWNKQSSNFLQFYKVNNSMPSATDDKELNQLLYRQRYKCRDGKLLSERKEKLSKNIPNRNCTKNIEQIEQESSEDEFDNDIQNILDFEDIQETVSKKKSSTLELFD